MSRNLVCCAEILKSKDRVCTVCAARVSDYQRCRCEARAFCHGGGEVIACRWTGFAQLCEGACGERNEISSAIKAGRDSSHARAVCALQEMHSVFM